MDTVTANKFSKNQGLISEDRLPPKAEKQWKGPAATPAVNPATSTYTVKSVCPALSDPCQKLI
jgi:hypothetical protein